MTHLALPRPTLPLLLVCLCAALAGGQPAPPVGVHASAVPLTLPAPAAPGAAVAGTTTTWRVALLKVRNLDRIPHTSYVGYGRSSLTRFYVLSLRLTNTGSRAASPQNDLILTMKVRPPDPQALRPGYAQVSPTDKPLRAVALGAARDYGGAQPSVVTKPGATTDYIFLIEVYHPYKHYGLFNFAVANGIGKYVYVLDLGF